ncbi:hypothetical protein [Candidatus Poriferisocius sp.]|uniref:hypothetical protein n=1 Tax=Candidatus Poriferisocius sp. TaxID=3101276 RepID=UPI003B01FED1
MSVVGRSQAVGILLAVSLVAWLPWITGADAQGGSRGPTLHDISVRDELIADQEALLNIYRCNFDVNTHLVPGGCVSGKPGHGRQGPAPFEGPPTRADISKRDWLIAVQELDLNIFRCRFKVDTHVIPGGCPTEPPEFPEPLSWESSGDSYSSGLGIEPYSWMLGENSDGYCKRSDEAYGPKAAEILRERKWEIDWQSETMTACSGHHIEQFFNFYPDVESFRFGIENRTTKRGLWDQGRYSQAGPERVDVLTFSFGGNDIGFGRFEKKLLDCFNPFSRCSPFTDTADNIAHLLDPIHNCTGLRYEKEEPGRYTCDLLIDEKFSAFESDDIRGGLADFYVHVVNITLTDRGRLYVVGYPALIAEFDEWQDGGSGERAQGCSDKLRYVPDGPVEDVVNALNWLARTLNSTMKQAVGRANAELGDIRVHYLDLYRLYRTGTHQTMLYPAENLVEAGELGEWDYGTGGSHELCGNNEGWMRGLGGDARLHPTQAGHAAAAEALADLIMETHPYLKELNKYHRDRSLYLFTRE